MNLPLITTCQDAENDSSLIRSDNTIVKTIERFLSDSDLDDESERRKCVNFQFGVMKRGGVD